MRRLNRKLRELEDSNRSIKVGLAGCGLMGTGMVSQLVIVDGMRPSLVADRHLDKILNAFKLANIDESEILFTNDLGEINRGINAGKYVGTTEMENLTRADVDIVVDATGNPMAGAEIALASIENNKDLVLLNVELDSVVGPILYEKAKAKGLVYTGTAGDEPGSVKELYDFAVLSGFQVLAMGKGKNNPIDYGATEEGLKEEAKSKNLKPSMLAGFVDGTNTMIEMTVMSNATGFKPDTVGGYGIEAAVDELPKILSLKSEGGILNNYGVVDYVHGIAPGVFVIVRPRLPQVHSEMQFLKMGDGPNYILYRPYHLTSLETPITIARAVIDREATIAPEFGQVSDTVALAKKDLRVGDYLDGIGKFTVYGTIETHENTRKNKYIPISLVNEKARVIKDIKKGDFLTEDNVELDESTLIYSLRQEQEGKNL